MRRASSAARARTSPGSRIRSATSCRSSRTRTRATCPDPRPRPGTGYREVMQTVRSRDGTTIAYDRRGSGPPVVLVGGALSDRRGAAALVEVLGERATAVGFDRRGRGDSTDTEPYAVEREIEDLGALIEAVGSPAFVYGHSSGAVLSLRAVQAGL